MFKSHLSAIIQGKDLSEKQMSEVMETIFCGQATDAMIGAFMGALATKGETFVICEPIWQ